VRFLKTLLSVLLAAFCIWLAVNNRAAVPLDLAPLGAVVELPLFLWLFATLAVGIVIGGAVMWWDGRRVRQAARQRGRELAVVRQQVPPAPPYQQPVPPLIGNAPPPV
jgi:uncharacterized integral membrane protein